MMYRVVLVEDEENALRLLESKLIETGVELTIVGRLSSLTTAVDFIKNNSFDILFLDIALRDGSGFELLERIGQVNFEIIFTTAYSQYAINAFNVNAVDYLLKPIMTDRLCEAVLRATDRLKSKSGDALNHLTAMLNERKSIKKLALKERGKILFLNPEDIIYLKAEGVYSEIKTRTNKYLNSNHLGYFEKILDEHLFFRIHRSYMVNMDQIQEYLTHEHVVKMSDNACIPISPGVLKRFLHRLSYQ